MWAALKRKILVRHNVRRRGILSDGASDVCPLCGDEDDTVDHLLSDCRFTWGVLCSFLSLFGCSWVLGRGVKGVTSRSFGGPSKGNQGWHGRWYHLRFRGQFGKSGMGGSLRIRERP